MRYGGPWPVTAGAMRADRPGPLYREVADPGSLVNKLVRRITLGLTPSELSLANSLGYQGYLEYHLNYTAIDDSALNSRLAPLLVRFATAFSV